MKGLLHFIEADLRALEQNCGWASIDVVDEHWFWLWAEIHDNRVDQEQSIV